MRHAISFIFIIIGIAAKSQKVENIYFHLYTDSLKKSVHNYINVDGKLENGRFLPLNNTKIDFWSSAGKWEGNDLIIDSSFHGDSVKIKATLKSEPQLSKMIIVYLKKNLYQGEIKTMDDVLGKKD